jgi:hypothetical protein
MPATAGSCSANEIECSGTRIRFVRAHGSEHTREVGSFLRRYGVPRACEYHYELVEHRLIDAIARWRARDAA